MGGKKVEIKRIENKSSRQVTFSKRRNGLIEKARQLSILCESSIAVLVVSGSGKLYKSASGDNMSKIIDRYEIHHADELEALDLAEKTRNYLPLKELLEIVQSKLEESDVDNASVDTLISLEEQLETALSVTRARKTELMMGEVKSLQKTDLAEKIRNYLPHKELLEIVQSVDSLISMEEQLETALSVIRAKKTELMMEDMKSLQEREKLLIEENQILASQVGKKTFLVIEGDRGMSWENGSGNKVRETLPLLK
uniref:MADS affecting flowering 2 variant 3 n=1 Tax=Arabidopsis thaliana TaxID=3702 RepID=D9MWU5_ARATH|nr:MADS affecting flowering 2 variant 3 [Arabidopsis thaliana]